MTPRHIFRATALLLTLPWYVGCSEGNAPSDTPATTTTMVTTTSSTTVETTSATTAPGPTTSTPGVSSSAPTSATSSSSSSGGPSTAPSNGTTTSAPDEPSSAATTSAETEASDGAPSEATGEQSATTQDSSSQGAGASSSDENAAYTPCPTDGPCIIMPYGDSITEGYPIWGGYRIELFRLANQDDHEITFVGSASNGPDAVDGMTFPKKHEGHGGYTIQDVPARNANGIFQFARPSMTTYKPHIILLAIGTNDINGNMDVATAPNRLGQLLDEIYSVDPDVFVALAQIVPSQTDGTNQALATYNSAIPALVADRSAQGRHIVLVDMYSAFADTPNYKQALLGDNLHPNQAGYAKMAEVWYAAIEPLLR